MAEKDRERFRRLTALSYFLFDSFGFENLKQRTKFVGEGLLTELRDTMVHNRPVLLDLLKKKMRGETLSKTEREYFSRVVKKKLLALADPDVQRLTLKALQ